MADKTKRLLRRIKRTTPKVTPIATGSEFILPNLSGISRHPEMAAPQGFVKKTGDTMTGDLIIASDTSSGLIIRTTDTSDPSLHFVSTNSAHDFDIHLDENATNDTLVMEGHTASVDTEILIQSLAGQAGIFHLKAGDNEAHLKMDTSGDLEILNENTDKDIVFKYTHAAEDHTITISAEDNKLKHSTGTFDFDNDRIVTTGSALTGALTVTGIASFSGAIAANAGLITSTTGAISFSNENLSTTGTLSAGAITATDNLTFTGSTKGLVYGSMYNDNTSTTVVIAAAGTFVRIPSGFTVGQVNNTSLGNAREITVLEPGMYKIDWSVTLNSTGFGPSNLEGAIGIDNTNNAQGSAGVNTGGAQETISGTAILDLADNAVVSIMLANITNTDNLTVEQASLSIIQVGGT